MKNFETIKLKEELKELKLQFSMIATQIRNAIVDLEEGDIDEAIADLKSLIGD